LSYSILNKSGTSHVGLLIRWKLRPHRLKKVEERIYGAGDTYESITAEMDYVFASFAGLPRSSKEILDKIYLNAL
jgi:hypothetical protein